jgi:MscS family membrane protein
VNTRFSFLALSLALLLTSGLPAPIVAQEPPVADAEPVPPAPPPVPPEFASARATMRTFLRAFDPQYGQPGVDPLDVAASCLDLSAIPAEARGVRGPELADSLKEILDRTVLIAFEDVPDEPDGEPYELEIHPPEPGHPGKVALAPDADGRWLFSRETVREIPYMLAAVAEREIVEGAVTEGPKPFSKWLREQVPESLQGGGFLLEPWQWLALLVLIVVGWVLDRVVTGVLHAVISRRLGRRMEAIEPEKLEKALRPVGLLSASLLWWLGITWLSLPTGVLTVLVIAVRFIALTSLVWAAYRLVDVLSSVLEGRARKTQRKFDDLLVPLVRKSLKVVVAVFGLIFIAQNLKLPLASLLAGVGIGGLALALAAQDTVRNLFGSFMVILDQPFSVGDWVVIGEVEGTVVEVGFRSTRIRTFYNSVVTLPNSNLISAAVDNYGARDFRRWSTRLAIAYETPPEKIEAFCEGVRELIRRHPYTRKDFFEVQLNELGASGLEIMLYVFFVASDWSTEVRERHRLAVDVLRLARDLDVDFAYPTQTLYLRRPGEAPEPPPADGYGRLVRDTHEDVRQRAQRLVDGSLEGKVPPPVGSGTRGSVDDEDD